MSLVCFHLFSQFLLHISSTQINIFINILIRILPMDNISEVSASIHLISVQVLSVIITPMTFLFNHTLFEFEFVLN